MTYVWLALWQAPIALLIFGAFRRLANSRHTYNRFQALGAGFLAAGLLSRIVILDPNFGAGRGQEWTAWFTRGETAAFCIGLILLGLGLFLSRRPRHPAYRPWPAAGKMAAAAAILCGAFLAITVFRDAEWAWLDLPWEPPRLVFTAGLYPFALLYALRKGNITPPVEDDAGAAETGI